ncbi:hypothetical protein M9Y10_040947 [Tritrichomonas musculus]|uniref:Uncharacterized protein n=1 Tax=Tritrichomonas musculus TaxID=1915356 RepID=A0ABR2K3Z5_9EUKA
MTLSLTKPCPSIFDERTKSENGNIPLFAEEFRNIGKLLLKRMKKQDNVFGITVLIYVYFFCYSAPPALNIEDDAITISSELCLNFNLISASTIDTISRQFWSSNLIYNFHKIHYKIHLEFCMQILYLYQTINNLDLLILDETSFEGLNGVEKTFDISVLFKITASGKTQPCAPIT